MTFIPGMTGAMSMTSGVPPLLSELEKIAHSSAVNTPTLAWPAGYEPEEGDLAVIYNWCYTESNGNSPGVVIPTGFTSIFNNTGPSGEIDPPDPGMTRVILSYRIMSGLEDTEVDLVGMNANRREGMIMIIFRGNIPISSVVLKGSNFNISPNNPDAQVIPSGSGTVPLIAFAVHAKNTTSTVVFTTNTPAFHEIVSAISYMIFGYRVYLSTPSNITVDADRSGSGDTFGQNLVSGYLEVA